MHHVTMVNDSDSQRAPCHDQGWADRILRVPHSYCNVCTVVDVALDFSELSDVTTVGDRWFSNFRSRDTTGRFRLSTVDWTGLSSVTTIGQWFFSDVPLEAETIDLLPLSNVTSIGRYFISNEFVRKLDLRPLRHLSACAS